MVARKLGWVQLQLSAIALVASVGLSPGRAEADVVLSYNSAAVQLDASGTYRWTNPGVGTGDHAFYHSWWYRVGSGGGESRVSSLQLVDTVILGPSAVRFEFRDAGGQFRLATQYGLSEVGGKSLLRETLVFNNLTSASLDVSLFMLSQQTDLDVNLSLETPSDYDGVEWVDSSTVRQSSGRVRGAVVSSAVEGGSAPNAYQMGFGQYNFFTTPYTYFSPIGGLLRDAAPTNLAWSTSEPHALPARLRSNLEWAWQWNAAVDAQSTAFVDVANRLSVPEPSTLYLLLLVLPCMARMQIRRSRSGPPLPMLVLTEGMIGSMAADPLQDNRRS